MSLRSVLVEVWEIVPIVLLLLVGGMIALRSGADRPKEGLEFGQIVRNLSQMIFRIAGYVRFCSSFSTVLASARRWVGE